MKITTALLAEHGACAEGAAWVRDRFGEDGEYQDVLDALAEAGKSSWAGWLLERLGTTDAVRNINGDLVSDHGIYFAGSLKVTGNIETTGNIEARNIKASYIKATGDIKASYIRAGVVAARERPDNCICGEFIPLAPATRKKES